MVNCNQCGLLQKDTQYMSDVSVCLWSKERIEEPYEDRKCKNYFIKIPNYSPEAHYKMKFNENRVNKSYRISIISIIIAILALIIAICGDVV